MDKKQHILNEIKRTAEKNDGVPLGRDRFFAATGIKETDWLGKPWNDWDRWSDVQKEAGYIPNKKQGAYKVDVLIQKLIEFIRLSGCFPVTAAIRREAARNKDFPSPDTLKRRLGNKNTMIKAIVDFCLENPDEYQDVLEICEPLVVESDAGEDDFSDFQEDENFGFVYLMKSGKHYKIGKTNAIDRRQYEIGIQLPEKIEPVHSIRTDDPSGIEAYWHNRFKDKRLNGEWFNLTAADVRVFKKRKFM